ncbi:MAG: hypothetical protein HOP04_10815 [Methylophilaceae bacterium]|nr:hypothetical protein [Methylophilaceae bacterium]
MSESKNIPLEQVLANALMKSSFGPKLESHIALSLAASESRQQLAKTVQEPVRDLQKAFADLIADMVSAFAKLPGELRPAMRSLVGLGWFPSGEMGFSEIHAFRQACDAGNKVAVDQAMVDWLRTEMPEIRKRLSNRFPLRHQILDAAFAAHESAKYELSIPVFLAQVEGMCLEVLGTKLFSTKSGVPVTRESTEALSRMELSEVLLLPLRELHGLTASKASRGNWPDAPNRHEILHGISTDYATPINSYKAISLLEYFCTFVAPRLDADWPRI